MTLKAFITQQAVGGAIINAVLNGPIGLLLLQADTKWPLWGLPSVSVDTCAMAFGIAWGTGWILTPQLRKQIASGKVVVPRLPQQLREDFHKWPLSGMQRGLNLGGFALLLFALPAVLGMMLFGVESWGREPITVFKTVFGFVVGSVFTPVTALAVAAEVPVAGFEAVAPSEG